MRQGLSSVGLLLVQTLGAAGWLVALAGTSGILLLAIEIVITRRSVEAAGENKIAKS
jgi:hypothetical protein